MGTHRQKVVIAYNGLDGACSAAMALLRLPKAELEISSRYAVAHTLARLSQQKSPPGEIHVCGLGMEGDWAQLAAGAEKLRRQGTKILWHCGRGYLDDQRARLAQLVTPVFVDCASNTEGVCRHFGLADHCHARFLLRLAKHDPHIALAQQPPDEDSQLWIDLVDASFAEYYKYEDRQRYVATIRKLALGNLDEQDRRVIRANRQYGFRYALLGRSPALRKTRELVRNCAAAGKTVLILGESGVGKEHIAHLIHQRSRRSDGPFVAVNCAEFVGSAGLANSRLFGHVKGAFTDAKTSRKGVFQAASGGILFLDEVGDLPLEVQGKLLRVLEDGRVVPEGADEPVPTDALVLAATKRDLPAMVRQRAFREDLFYRLSVLRIPVPRLRDRKEDIDDIVESTLADLGAEGYQRKFKPAERRLLQAYQWPGNVRELIYVVQRAVYTGSPLEHVLQEQKQEGLRRPDAARQSAALLPPSTKEVQPLDTIRRRYAQEAFDLFGQNLKATAKALQISENTLRKLLRPAGNRQ